MIVIWLSRGLLLSSRAISNVNTSLQGFISDVKKLRDKLLHQNFNLDLFNSYIKFIKFIKAKPPCTYKYWEVIDFRLFI